MQDAQNTQELFRKCQLALMMITLFSKLQNTELFDLLWVR
jgi:hypothetical protein